MPSQSHPLPVSNGKSSFVGFRNQHKPEWIFDGTADPNSPCPVFIEVSKSALYPGEVALAIVDWQLIPDYFSKPLFTESTIGVTVAGEGGATRQSTLSFARVTENRIAVGMELIDKYRSKSHLLVTPGALECTYYPPEYKFPQEIALLPQYFEDSPSVPKEFRIELSNSVIYRKDAARAVSRLPVFPQLFSNPLLTEFRTGKMLVTTSDGGTALRLLPFARVDEDRIAVGADIIEKYRHRTLAGPSAPVSAASGLSVGALRIPQV